MTGETLRSEAGPPKASKHPPEGVEPLGKPALPSWLCPHSRCHLKGAIYPERILSFPPPTPAVGAPGSGVYLGTLAVPNPVFAGVLPCPSPVPHSWVVLPHLSRVFCSAAPSLPWICFLGPACSFWGRVWPGKNQLGKASCYLGDRGRGKTEFGTQLGMLRRSWKLSHSESCCLVGAQ